MRKWIKRAAAALGIALAALMAAAIVFLAPLPFVRPMWNAGVARWRMYETVSRRVIGLSEYEVRAMLGAPPFSGRSNGQRAFASRRGGCILSSFLTAMASSKAYGEATRLILA